MFVRNAAVVLGRCAERRGAEGVFARNAAVVLGRCAEGVYVRDPEKDFQRGSHGERKEPHGIHLLPPWRGRT